MATDIANKKEIMPELSGHERPTLVVDRGMEEGESIWGVSVEDRNYKVMRFDASLKQPPGLWEWRVIVKKGL